MAEEQMIIERYRVYTRDEAAALLRMTAMELDDVLQAAGWRTGVVDRAGLDWLLDRLLTAQSAERLQIEGMVEDRRAVVGGGLSVLRAVFELLGIEEMRVAQGSLRHGALYELLDQQHAKPVADTVRSRMKPGKPGFILELPGQKL